MRHTIDLETDKLEHLIDQHIHNARTREMLRMRLLDGVPYEALAERFSLSVRHTKTILYTAMNVLISHI